MKFAVSLIVFSILTAVGYGVVFSYTYPLTPIDGGLVSLAAVLGLATCLVLAGLWKLLGKTVQFVRSLTTGARRSQQRLPRAGIVDARPSGITMAKIFISYRRDDSSGTAGRVHDRLAQAFGDNLLFMDVDNIPLGLDFVKVLRDAVIKCEVLLAVIGQHWLDVRDAQGSRRLDNEDDFVRIEIATALQRDIPVIPILVDGAEIPKAVRLPQDLQGLSTRNGIDVRHSSFRVDIDRLINGLKAQMGELSKKSP